MKNIDFNPHPKHFLIVDDEDLMRHILRNIFELQGYIVSEARNDEEAINIIKSNQIHLVTLNTSPSKGSGFTLLHMIRRISNIPIIAVTADLSEASKVYCFKLGADDYITTPLSCDELIARINAIMRRYNQK